MSIIGKLIVDGQSFNMLGYRYRLHQNRDIAGKPRGRAQGGLIEIRIEAHRDHIFHHWMLNPEQMKDIEIVFSPVTGSSNSRTIQCYDVHCARLAVHFDNHTSNPMTYFLVMSPGIFVDGNVVFEKPWKITDLSTMGAEPTPDPAMLPQPKFLGFHFEDFNGERITQGSVQPEQNIFLIILTENARGETIKIDLNDDRLDFVYQNEVVTNDILTGISITGDRTRIQLKTIKEN